MSPELLAGRQYWAISGYDIQQGYPRDISNYGFPSSVRAIDAAVSYEGKTYFFINNQCWRWDERVFPLKLKSAFLCPEYKPSAWTSGDVLIYTVFDRLSGDMVKHKMMLPQVLSFFFITLRCLHMFWRFCDMNTSHPCKVLGWDLEKGEAWFFLCVEFWCSHMNVFLSLAECGAHEGAI